MPDIVGVEVLEGVPLNVSVMVRVSGMEGVEVVCGLLPFMTMA